MLQLRRSLCLAGLAFSLAGNASAQLVVYDNLGQGDWEPSLSIGTDEIGDQIVLADATPRLISTFTVQYLTQSLSGGETIRIRFYENDGAIVSGADSPGSLIYDSQEVAFTPVIGRTELTLTDLNVTVPDSFTWSVQFSGVTGGEVAAVALVGPASVGSSQIGSSDDFWDKGSGSWVLAQFGGGSPSSFGAQLTAVPEPGAWALLTGGALLGYAAVRRKRMAGGS